MSFITQHRGTGNYTVLRSSDIPARRNHTPPSQPPQVPGPERDEFPNGLPQRSKLAYRSVFKGNTNILLSLPTLLSNGSQHRQTKHHVLIDSGILDYFRIQSGQYSLLAHLKKVTHDDYVCTGR